MEMPIYFNNIFNRVLFLVVFVVFIDMQLGLLRGGYRASFLGVF